MSQSHKSDFDLIQFTKLAIATIFNNNLIAESVYNTFIEEEFDDNDDILVDLANYNECVIISLSSTKIENNQIEWNEKHKQILYKILLTIFRHKIIDIDALCQQFSIYPSSKTSFIDKYTTNDLIEIAVKIINELNKALTNTININKITKLFTEMDINGAKLHQMNAFKFCELAKKYDIKASKSRKIFDGMQHYFYNRPNEPQIGSQYEFYSIIDKSWILIKVTNITKSTITIVHKENIQIVDRNSSQFRPIIVKQTVNDTISTSPHKSNVYVAAQIDSEELQSISNVVSADFSSLNDTNDIDDAETVKSQIVANDEQKCYDGDDEDNIIPEVNIENNNNQKDDQQLIQNKSPISNKV